MLWDEIARFFSVLKDACAIAPVRYHCCHWGTHWVIGKFVLQMVPSFSHGIASMRYSKTLDTLPDILHQPVFDPQVSPARNVVTCNWNIDAVCQQHHHDSFGKCWDDLCVPLGRAVPFCLSSSQHKILKGLVNSRPVFTGVCSMLCKTNCFHGFVICFN